jgi:protein tyrosine phosphatase (PTP) superfamily phosphohydrolase (DUF442 family)
MSSFNQSFITVVVLSLPALAGSAPGIKNFDKVDDHVYRGGQPTDAGFQHLAKLGVKVIIDLREADERAQAEKRVVTAAGMQYVNVSMTGLTPPTPAEINKILALMENTANGPVFVHCKRGADRTGAVIAAYHIDHDKWDNSRALKDAKAHSMSFFQLPRMEYIRAFRPQVVDAKTALPSGTVAAPSPADPTPAAVADSPATAAN